MGCQPAYLPPEGDFPQLVRVLPGPGGVPKGSPPSLSVGARQLIPVGRGASKHALPTRVRGKPTWEPFKVKWALPVETNHSVVAGSRLQAVFPRKAMGQMEAGATVLSAHRTRRRRTGLPERLQRASEHEDRTRLALHGRPTARGQWRRAGSPAADLGEGAWPRLTSVVRGSGRAPTYGEAPGSYGKCWQVTGAARAIQRPSRDQHAAWTRTPLPRGLCQCREKTAPGIRLGRAGVQERLAPFPSPTGLS